MRVLQLAEPLLVGRKLAGRQPVELHPLHLLHVPALAQACPDLNIVVEVKESADPLGEVGDLLIGEGVVER